MHEGSAGPTRCAWLDELNERFEALHTAKEDAFWSARMDLADDPDRAQAELDRLEIAMQGFLSDPERLKRTRQELERARSEGAAEEVQVALRGWIATLEAHAIEHAEARELAAEIVEDEGRLARARSALRLGYRDPMRGFVEAGSVELGVILRSDPDPGRRRAAWEGLRSIEPHVLDSGFLELVAKRNRLGRLLGAEDYYDWKTRQVEGMGKTQVFELLDELEERTREPARRALEWLRSRSASAARAWNVLYEISGNVAREQDPYFPFGSAVERWGRSFAALGIDYRGAELVLDLVDRPGKYENGFMHGPVIAWRKAGAHRPARIQFTANAIPGMVGSGQRAMETLFHEGGHAAHFANVDMPAPCFGQEFAPSSVAFAETQSMLLDSLLEDPDWQHRYALDSAFDSMPVALIEKGIRSRQPFAAWNARTMLAVCYGERALYELPEGELTPQRALETLRAVERRLLFIEDGSPRPILSVPHLLAGESSAYYHGYVLAEMAVEQTRAFFLERDGHLVDNPRMGPELARTYWAPGNSAGFVDLVERLTGEPVGAAALAARLARTAEVAVTEARGAIERLKAVPPFQDAVRLGGRIRIVHGRELVAKLDNGDFQAFATVFADWVDALAAARRS